MSDMWGMPSESIDLSPTPVSCPCDPRKALRRCHPHLGEPRAPDNRGLAFTGPHLYPGASGPQQPSDRGFISELVSDLIVPYVK